MKKIFFIIALAAILFNSCYKEDSITTEIGKPKFIIEDSEDEGLHLRYEFFKNTGVYILYEYDTTDYAWDISTISKNILVIPQNHDLLLKSIKYLEKTLTSHYSNEFMQKYFPLNILLSDSISHSQYRTPLFKDRACVTGRNYMGIGFLRENILDKIMSYPQILDSLKGEINGRLWAYIICANNLIEIPESFYQVSVDYYDASFSGEEEKDNEGYVQSFGFWGYDQENLGNMYMAPSRERDIYDFVSRMTSKSEAEMETLINKSDKLKIKYTLLRTAIKEKTGVDLQMIGNNKNK
jgi:hypothetical protein